MLVSHPRPRGSYRLRPRPNLAPATRRLDPLTALGGDIFHLVLGNLLINDLLAAEQVCKRWKSYIRTDDALWRQWCIAENLDHEIMVADKLQRPDWRGICLTYLPMNRAWYGGEAHVRCVPFTRLSPRTPRQSWMQQAFEFNPAALSTTCTFVSAAGVFVRSTHRGLRVDSWNTAASTPLAHASVSPYQQLDSASRYVVGMSTNNQLCMQAPKPLPTRIDIWRISGDSGVTGGTHDFSKRNARHEPIHLEFIGSPHHPPVWGYTMRLRTDSNGKTVLAVLSAETRMIGDDPSGQHWISCRTRRTVHLWHLDDGMRHQAIGLRDVGFVKHIELDDQYIFIPSSSHVHIYARSGGHVVSMETPSPQAALAFAVLPRESRAWKVKYWNYEHHHAPMSLVLERGGWRDDGCEWFKYGMDVAQAKPAESRREGFAKCRLTSTDLVCTASSGALVVVRNYRSALAQAAKLHPAARSSLLDTHTLVVGIGSHIEEIATHGERIAIKVFDKHREVIMTLDANEMPTVPRPAQTPSRSTLDTSSPRIQARIIASHREHRAVHHAMYLDRTGVYIPGTQCVKAYLFGQRGVGLGPR